MDLMTITVIMMRMSLVKIKLPIEIAFTRVEAMQKEALTAFQHLLQMSSKQDLEAKGGKVTHRSALMELCTGIVESWRRVEKHVELKIWTRKAVRRFKKRLKTSSEISLVVNAIAICKLQRW